MDPTVFGDGSDVIAGLVVDNARGTPRALFRYRLVLEPSILYPTGFL